MVAMLATTAMAGEVVVGYESSRAVGRLNAAARARMAKLPLQDLLHYTKGRHTMMKDDGISGHWGLSAVLARCEIGPRPFARLRNADGTGQCERVVFADTGTGATLMLLTQLPHSTDGPADELNYFGKSNWAADGSLMIYARSARPNLWGPLTQATTDTTGSMIVRADGTRPYIAFKKGLTLRPPICSPKRPDVGYAAVFIKRGQLEISEFSFSKNKVTRKLGTVDKAWWIKVSPDDKYLMGRSYTGVWVIRIDDGKKWDVKLDVSKTGRSYPIHDSYTFVPGNTDWFFYFYEPVHPGGGLRKAGQRLRLSLIHI